MVLEAVQNHPGISAERLAARLGVTERAVRRQVAVLREAGIPIEAERGKYGGYRIGRSLGKAPVVFTAAEAVGLVMAVLDGHHRTTDPGDPVSGALDKLLRTLPAPVAKHAEAMRRTVAPAPDRSAARPDPAITSAVVEACSTSHRIRIEYRSEAGNQWELEVDPWAVVVWRGRWYLLCWSHRNEERRTYRVDRVQRVDILADTFEPPDDLDPVADLEASFATGWEYEVSVLFHAPVEEVRPCLASSLGVLEPVDERSCRLTATTSSPVWYAEQLVAVRADFTVEAGDELRAGVAEVGARYARAARPPCGGRRRSGTAG